MFLHKKSLYALLSMMVMSVSLHAEPKDLLKELLKNPAGVKIDANGNCVARTKLDKTKAVAQTGLYAVAIGVLARETAKVFVPAEWQKVVSLVGGLAANGLLNWNVFATIKQDRSTLKNSETYATLAAIFGGSVLGHYGTGLAKDAKAKFRQLGSTSTKPPFKTPDTGN